MRCQVVCVLLLLVACGDASESGSAQEDGADASFDVAADTTEQEDSSTTIEGDAAVADTAPDAPDDVGTSPHLSCTLGYLYPSDQGDIEHDDLTEISGLVASRINPGVLWMHNDSGGLPRVFAVGADGSDLGELNLPLDDVRDLEDIAVAACPDGTGSCLWIGDIGDNGMVRSDIVVHAVPEPELVPGTGPTTMDAEQIWSFPVSYPDGALNSEGLVVLEDGSSFWVFEKSLRASVGVFRHPGLVDGQAAVLEEVATFTSPGIITGADLYPDGSRLLLRTYDGTYEYLLDPSQKLADIAMAERHVVSGTLAEPQGEAIGYDPVRGGFWSVSEGRNPPLSYAGCAACDDGDACTVNDSGDVCAGDDLRSSFEPNNMAPGDNLPDLNDCSTSFAELAAITQDDEDWYTFEDDTSGGCNSYVRLANMSSADVELCAWFQCEDGELPEIDCAERGAPATDSLEGFDGCCATLGPDDAGSIRLEADCGSGKHKGEYQVRVRSPEASACGIYEITRGGF